MLIFHILMNYKEIVSSDKVNNKINAFSISNNSLFPRQCHHKLQTHQNSVKLTVSLPTPFEKGLQNFRAVAIVKLCCGKLPVPEPRTHETSTPSRPVQYLSIVAQCKPATRVIVSFVQIHHSLTTLLARSPRPDKACVRL